MILDKMQDHIVNGVGDSRICAVMDKNLENMANTLRDLKHEEASLENANDSDDSHSCTNTEILGSDSDSE